MTERTREAISAIIKAYDVRGVVGSGANEVDESFVRDIGAAFGEGGDLGRSVKGFGLNADLRRHQPPVMGGKKAISRAPSNGASGFT